MRKGIKNKSTYEERQLAKMTKRRNKLNSLKNEFEGGKIKHFDQLFAIFSEASLSAELGVSYYTVKRKADNPGEFTMSEIIKLAELIGVSYELMSGFILARVKEKRDK